ncbi:hypothetical protein CFN78_20140 [Amycolatopsis antarctica]|uniref:Uncharacterized protein n=2 Tax=Amycolatopsis antarctica TaxID=1854586 RepID=A0A263D091_9PSEU|nr:hypothetical protein CFN78_20140 [Amycolatopsis antarctica]
MVPLLGITAATVATAEPASPAAACPDRMIFEVGGNGDPKADVYNGSNERLPAGVAFTKVEYSASIAPLPGNPISMDDSVAEGIGNLDRAVRDFHGACGGAQITISGYSQGAIVAGDVLNALSADTVIPHGQVNGVLYGDPRRPSDNGPGGIEGNIPTIIPGLSMKGERGFGDIAVHEICNKNDTICFSENPITNLLGFANGVVGYLSGDHRYVIDPHAHMGNGDTVHDQPPRVPHGPPLPLPIGTPWEIFNGNLGAAQDSVTQIRNQVANALSPELRDRLAELPFLSVPSA